MGFDEQIAEKEFTVFLRVHAKEVISVTKNTRSLKGSRHIFDSDHFDQYLKYALCEKADEILYKFYMKHPQIKHFYNKTLLAVLIISRRDAALVYCLRGYLQEKDPSLIVLLNVLERPAYNLSYFLIVKFCIFQDFW